MNILQKIFKKPIYKPQVEIPLDDQVEETLNVTYSEEDSDLQVLVGTNIAFGYSSKTIIDEAQNTKTTKKQNLFLAGSAKKVIDSPRQIVGVCLHCHNKINKQIKKGIISKDEAQLLSLITTDTLAICQRCNIQTCTTHSKLIETNGQSLRVCPDCQKKLKSKFKWLGLVVIYLFSTLAYIFSEESTRENYR